MESSPQWIDFLRMLVEPRKTLRKYLEDGSPKIVLALAGLFGIENSLNWSNVYNFGDKFGLKTLLAAAVLLGPFMGILIIYFQGFLISMTGSWIGGKAKASDTRLALAFGNIPSVFVLPLWVPVLLYGGEKAFTSSQLDLSGGAASAAFAGVVLMQIGIIKMIMGVWTFILVLKGISETQGFSLWKAFGNILLTIVIFFIALFPIALVAVVILKAAKLA